MDLRARGRGSKNPKILLTYVCLVYGSPSKLFLRVLLAWFGSKAQSSRAGTSLDQWNSEKTDSNPQYSVHFVSSYLEVLLCALVECAVVGPELEEAHLEAGGGHPVHDPAVRLRVRLHAEHLRQADRVLQQRDVVPEPFRLFLYS